MKTLGDLSFGVQFEYSATTNLKEPEEWSIEEDGFRLLRTKAGEEIIYRLTTKDWSVRIQDHLEETGTRELIFRKEQSGETAHRK